MSTTSLGSLGSLLWCCPSVLFHFYLKHYGCWKYRQDVPTGELPRNLLLAVDRNMVQKTVPGTRVTVVGIYSIFQAGGSGPE